MSISRQSLLYSLDTLLQPEKFKDYGPNGLQVEGKEPVSLLVSGVTASLALIDAAIEAQADAILVHHGLFWRGQDGRVTGWMKQRLQRLLAHDINLFAYHLPLDAHPALGNNARLGAQLGWEVDAHFGDQDLGCLAHVQYAGSAELCAQVGRVLGREPVCVPGHTGPSRAWAGAQVARRDTSNPPPPLVRRCLSRAKSPSRRRTWRRKWVWALWPPATTPLSAMARRPWRPTWRSSWGFAIVSSKWKTRPSQHRAGIFQKT
jgi:putative NIF3 family GTP cyclohydrolase 1 type 2